MKEHIEQLLLEIEENKCQLFDVRESEEWQNNHLDKAILQPLSLLKKGTLLHQCDKKKKTYLYCKSGKRVFPASALLKALGFSEVIPLNEGFVELNTLGLKSKY